MNSEPLEVRLYRRMLRFFPEKFQRDYADEMLLTFRDNLKDATCEGRLPSFCFESIVDLISSLRRERASQPLQNWNTMNRYDDRTRLAFAYAREERSRFGFENTLNAEHVLLGLLRDATFYQFLQGRGCSLEMIRHEIRSAYEEEKPVVAGKNAFLAVETQHLVRIASKLAKTETETIIEPRHMLLAILEQPWSLAFRVLTKFAPAEEIRASI